MRIKVSSCSSVKQENNMEMEKDKIVFKGSHPDSLYRVAADSGASGNKMTRVLRVMRWPVALVAVCIALGAFVYFLMPDNLDSASVANGTYWEPAAAGVGLRGQPAPIDQGKVPKDGTSKIGSKTSEIDFYEAENDKDIDVVSVIDTIAETNTKRGLPIPPVFPTHLTPEVQYGNEKADSEKRTPKLLESITPDDSTLKPHITQKPEKPLAIYFNDATAATTETITRSETINDFTNYDQKQTNKKVEEIPVKTHPSAYKEYVVPTPRDLIIETEQDTPRQQGVHPSLAYPPEGSEYYNRDTSNSDVNFTSGHSKLFGISIEDAERMKSTTQSALYNTRVSPTLPTWRDGDDTTTKKYPTNIYPDVHCRSTRMPFCLGVLPYDLAGAAVKLGHVDITSLMPQIDYLVATNCSDRVRHFLCALLEPECSPLPYAPKLPCHNLCSAIVDSCDGHIPQELLPAFNCKQYSYENCVAAKTPCYSREFSCSDGTCIPRDWICDNRNDCPAGEDEHKCIECDTSEFKCASGSCILKRWLCDGYTDCPNGDDESASMCGPRHVQVPADRHSEPGEESAGSAPAPAVRRPNKVPIGRRKSVHRPNENDSSKELLVTSYSNNAFTLMRNFTPSPSRLTPYNRSSLHIPKSRKQKKEESRETTREDVEEPPKVDLKKTVSVTTQASTKAIVENESVEDVNMGDLGFFDDIEKEGKSGTPKPTSQRPKPRLHSAPAPSVSRPLRPAPPEAILPEKTGQTRLQLNKATNSFSKVIDGAALLRQANAAAAEDPIDVEKENNNTSYEKEVLAGVTFGGAAGAGAGASKPPPGASAHASPCPSGELRCVDGRCITLSQLCDGAIDCSDHADEDNCYT